MSKTLSETESQDRESVIILQSSVFEQYCTVQCTQCTALYYLTVAGSVRSCRDYTCTHVSCTRYSTVQYST